MKPELSIIIPVYNEENNLQELFERISRVMQHEQTEYEVIFIDDGSTDGSLEIIKKIQAGDNHCRYFSFSRNFGHEAASSCGFHMCKGSAAVLMDADLQDPPEMIPAMLEQWRNGFSIVHVRRKKRAGEKPATRLTSYLFYRVLNYFSEIEIPKDVGDFHLIDRKVIAHFNAMGERNRFVRGIIPWIGFKQTVIDYDRAARAHGKTKYNFIRRLLLSFDAITGFSLAPLRLCIMIGFVVTVFSLIMSAIIIVQKIFLDLNIPGYALLTSGLFLLAGIQLTFLGVIGEYIGKIFTEVRSRPLYIIDERSDAASGKDD